MNRPESRSFKDFDLPNGTFEERVRTVVQYWDRIAEWVVENAGGPLERTPPQVLKSQVLNQGAKILRGYALFLAAVGQTKKHLVIREAAYRTTKQRLTMWRDGLKGFLVDKRMDGQIWKDEPWFLDQITSAEDALHDLEIKYGKLIEQ
ncbi:MAG: hypothetical protein G01um10148_272 [Parcubacteria group bacterium Gr01-1014_8]|nr:MAG: hypothetical protein G01um10148_272 [Parcubacteria group bacterium Gr01-1014_8]